MSSEFINKCEIDISVTSLAIYVHTEDRVP